MTRFHADLLTADKSLNADIRKHLASLGYDLKAYDAVPYYENPFFDRNWEIHNLVLPNFSTDLLVALKQTEVRFLEEYAKTHCNDAAALEKLEAAKADLHRMAVSTGYID